MPRFEVSMKVSGIGKNWVIEYSTCRMNVDEVIEISNVVQNHEFYNTLNIYRVGAGKFEIRGFQHRACAYSFLADLELALESV